VWTDTAAGEIEFVNQPYLNYLGGTLEEVKDWQTALHPDDRERVKAEWSRSLETGQPFETEVRIRRARLPGGPGLGQTFAMVVR
jgi:PAS domain-containing protein